MTSTTTMIQRASARMWGSSTTKRLPGSTVWWRRYPRRRTRGRPLRRGPRFGVEWLRRRRASGGARRRPAEPPAADPLRRRQLHRHPAAAGSSASPRARAVRLRLVVVGIRHQRESAVCRGRPGRPAHQPVCHHQAGGGAAVLQLPPSLRPEDGVPTLLHGLRTPPTPGDGDPQVHRPSGPRRRGSSLRSRELAPDYTYIDDIVDGIVASYDLAPGFEIFNLGGAETTRLSDLVRWLADELAVEPRIQYLPEQPGGRSHYLRRRRQGRAPPRVRSQGSDPRRIAPVRGLVPDPERSNSRILSDPTPPPESHLHPAPAPAGSGVRCRRAALLQSSRFALPRHCPPGTSYSARPNQLSPS